MLLTRYAPFQNTHVPHQVPKRFFDLYAEENNGTCNWEVLAASCSLYLLLSGGVNAADQGRTSFLRVRRERTIPQGRDWTRLWLQSVDCGCDDVGPRCECVQLDQCCVECLWTAGGNREHHQSTRVTRYVAEHCAGCFRGQNQLSSLSLSNNLSAESIQCAVIMDVPTHPLCCYGAAACVNAEGSANCIK